MKITVEVDVGGNVLSKMCKATFIVKDAEILDFLRKGGEVKELNEKVEKKGISVALRKAEFSWAVPGKTLLMDMELHDKIFGKDAVSMAILASNVIHGVAQKLPKSI